MRNLKAPILAKDAVYKLVDYGLPLERFNNDNTYLQFYKEREFLARTSEFKPTLTPNFRNETSLNWRFIRHLTSDLYPFDTLELRRFAYESEQTIREFELADPLRGNSLVSIKYKHSILYLFSAGARLSQLVLSTTFLKPFQVKPDYTVQLPLDKLKVIETIDLKYPIRQITFSPISSTVFIVRTTSSIHVFSLEDLVLKQVHRIFLPDETEIYRDIDYSMPIHVELSPYHLYQYLFVTNNGYISIMDAAENKVIFNSIDPFPEDWNYVSRWKSCGIGTTPSTLFIASTNTIQLWDIRADSIKTNTLARSNTPITAFATSKSKSLFCFATSKSVVFFDTINPTKPFMTYKHHFNIGAPSLVSIEELDTDNNWRTFVFSNQSQQLSILDFEYLNTPSKSVTPKVTVKKVFSFTLSLNEFERLSNYVDNITAMGLNIKTQDKSDGREFISIERLFEDGSIRIQYIEMSNETPKEELELITRPQYTIVPNPEFQNILEDAIISFLPEFGGYHYPQVQDLHMDRIYDYVEDICTDTATNKLTDQEKTSVASKVRQLKYPTPFGKLFENSSFLSYDLNELETFLNQLEQYEDIEIIKQLNIPHLLKDRKSIDPVLTAQLESAHEKKMRLYSATIRPLPEKYEPKTPLQYVTNEDVTYNSTTTTKVLAHYWPVNSTSYKELTFPNVDTTLVVPPETFPSATAPRKRQASEDFGLPSITIEEDLSLPTILEVKKRKAPKKVSSQQSQEFLEPPSPARSFTAVSTQPVPGAFGSRSKSVTKKKKKSKSSGFK